MEILKKGSIYIKAIGDNRNAGKAFYEAGPAFLRFYTSLEGEKVKVKRKNGSYAQGVEKENSYLCPQDTMGGWLLKKGQPVYWFALQEDFDPADFEVPDEKQTCRAEKTMLPVAKNEFSAEKEREISVESIAAKPFRFLSYEEILSSEPIQPPFSDTGARCVRLGTGAEKENEAVYVGELCTAEKKVYFAAIPLSTPRFCCTANSILLRGRNGKMYCLAYETEK